MEHTQEIEVPSFETNTKPRKTKQFFKNALLAVSILGVVAIGYFVNQNPWLVWVINILLASSIVNAIYRKGSHKSMPLVVCAIILWIIALMISTWQALIGGLLLSLFVFVGWFFSWVKKKFD